MNYQQAIEYLASYTDYELVPRLPHNAANYDLMRVHELLSHTGSPHLKAKSVHITGTNGKGSVAAMIASALVASGYTTGLYTSPHLHTWRERIKVNDVFISEEELVTLIETIKPEVEAVNQRATYGRLTTFELLTTLAFAYFNQKAADFQVLEVGMGGRFDATSVIVPEVSVLTPISLEHTDVLGGTLAEIAGEKAAIIKLGGTGVISPQPAEVETVLEEIRAGQGAKLVWVGRDVIWEGHGFDLDGQRLQVKGRLDSYELSIPLLGQHQLINAATAVAALEVLMEKGYKVAKEQVISGLAAVKWPGRFHILSKHPLLLVDGAHNPGAARRLKESIEQYLSFEQAILIIGISSDKDIASIVSELAPIFNKIIVTRANHPRATPPELIAAEFKRHKAEVQVAATIAEALSQARALAGERDLICVTGSLFIVAGAIEQANRLALSR